MPWWGAMGWGLFGGALVAGLDFVAVIGRIGDWPWRARKKLRPGPYLAATVVRLGLGAGLAVAVQQSGFVASPIGAVTVGVATPLLVEKLGQAGADMLTGGGGR